MIKGDLALRQLDGHVGPVRVRIPRVDGDGLLSFHQKGISSETAEDELRLGVQPPDLHSLGVHTHFAELHVLQAEIQLDVEAVTVDVHHRPFVQVLKRNHLPVRRDDTTFLHSPMTAVLITPDSIVDGEASKLGPTDVRKVHVATNDQVAHSPLLQLTSKQGPILGITFGDIQSIRDHTDREDLTAIRGRQDTTEDDFPCFRVHERILVAPANRVLDGTGIDEGNQLSLLVGLEMGVTPEDVAQAVKGLPQVHEDSVELLLRGPEVVQRALMPHVDHHVIRECTNTILRPGQSPADGLVHTEDWVVLLILHDGTDDRQIAEEFVADMLGDNIPTVYDQLHSPLLPEFDDAPDDPVWDVVRVCNHQNLHDRSPVSCSFYQHLLTNSDEEHLAKA